MIFNSFEFLCLLVVTLFLYYIPLLRSWQVFTLVISSAVFYAWHDPRLLLLLVGCIAGNAALSHRMAWSSTLSQAVIYMVAGVTFNVILLASFKYAPLFAIALPANDGEIKAALLSIPLPIGISFYTFENISLLIEVARRRKAGIAPFVPRQPSRHFLHSSLFVAFFPHLVSGPILKADDFFPQIRAGWCWREVQWETAFRHTVEGLFLKMVVADNLKEVTSLMIYPQFVPYSSFTLLLLLVAFSFQIFADFAGYSLMALGLATLFGYRLPENFNFPYISTSLSEFWRRWHISLSSWLRHYLYLPLGGNRRGKSRTYFNLFMVMFIGGLWHGAAWSFAVWGLYHGLGLALERLADERWPELRKCIPSKIQVIWVFCFVSMGWLLFRLPNFAHVVAYLKCLSQNWSTGFEGQKKIWLLVLVFGFPIILMHLSCWWRERCHGANIISWSIPQWVRYGAMLAGILISSGLPGTFIYFQF